MASGNVVRLSREEMDQLRAIQTEHGYTTTRIALRHAINIAMQIRDQSPYPKTNRQKRAFYDGE